MKVMVIPLITCALETIPKGLVKGLEGLKIGGRTEIIQTTALLREVSSTPVKDHQLTLVWNTRKE